MCLCKKSMEAIISVYTGIYVPNIYITGAAAEKRQCSLETQSFH